MSYTEDYIKLNSNTVHTLEFNSFPYAYNSYHEVFICKRCEKLLLCQDLQTKRRDLDSRCKDCLADLESKENDVKLLVVLLLVSLRRNNV